jgi:O-acetyl-ADP-ribose deacetylase (regulator of RNase III)
MRSHGQTAIGTQHLRINNVGVLISSVPIEKLVRFIGFDALVSSDNTQLSMQGGVSRAIRIAGGEAIAKEARRLAPLKVGDVAVTSAGKLPARYVLHAVTVDWELLVRPGELTIRLAAENVFRRCEALGVRSLAMPALGIGAARFAADHSARLIVAALAKHAASPTIIKQVVFLLPDPEAFRAFSVFLQTAVREAGIDTQDSTGAHWGDLGMAESSPLPTTATPTTATRRRQRRRRQRRLQRRGRRPRLAS